MSNNNVETPQSRSKAGFDVHPENINKDGAPPKELTYTELIKQVGDQQSAYDALKKRKTVAIEAQWDKAEKGDNQSFNTLIDRVEGKVKQDVGIGGASDGSKIQIEIVMIDPKEKK